MGKDRASELQEALMKVTDIFDEYKLNYPELIEVCRAAVQGAEVKQQAEWSYKKLKA